LLRDTDIISTSDAKYDALVINPGEEKELDGYNISNLGRFRSSDKKIYIIGSRIMIDSQMTDYTIIDLDMENRKIIDLQNFLKPEDLNENYIEDEMKYFEQVKSEISHFEQNKLPSKNMIVVLPGKEKYLNEYNISNPSRFYYRSLDGNLYINNKSPYYIIIDGNMIYHTIKDVHNQNKKY